jgi:predicted ATP-dependent Lon-type protease
VQITNLLGSNISSGIGSAVYISIISAIYTKNLKPGLAVLGNISVGGAIERSINFADKITMLSENGAKTVIVPMDNLSELSGIPQIKFWKVFICFQCNNKISMKSTNLGIVSLISTWELQYFHLDISHCKYLFCNYEIINTGKIRKLQSSIQKT